jgi:hypothetical protein
MCPSFLGCLRFFVARSRPEGYEVHIDMHIARQYMSIFQILVESNFHPANIVRIP